jgi:hypothetical protein
MRKNINITLLRMKAFSIASEKNVDFDLFYTLFVDYAKTNGGYDGYMKAYNYCVANNTHNNAYYVTHGKALTESEFNTLLKLAAYSGVIYP